MKNIAVQKSEISKDIIETFNESNNIYVEEFSNINDICIGKFNLVVLDSYYDEIPENIKGQSMFINVYPSLFPAFAGDRNALEKAYISVKVSGITVLNENTGKILAQYPVLIGIDTSFGEYIQEITKAKKLLLPAVIKCIIKDSVFDFTDLLKHKCSNNHCSNCNNCHISK